MYVDGTAKQKQQVSVAGYDTTEEMIGGQAHLISGILRYMNDVAIYQTAKYT